MTETFCWSWIVHQWLVLIVFIKGWLQRNQTGRNCCETPPAPPILFHPLFVFPFPPGLLGGFPLSAGTLHLLPGFLHGWPVRSTQDPPVPRPGEGHPRPGLPRKRGGWVGGCRDGTMSALTLTTHWKPLARASVTSILALVMACVYAATNAKWLPSRSNDEHVNTFTCILRFCC